MKKLFTLLLSVVILATGFTMVVYAASGINAAEQAILDKLDSYSHTVNGKTLAFDSNMKTQAKNYFMRDDVELTETDKDYIIGKLDAAYAVVVRENVTDLNNLSADGKTEVLGYINNAADYLGLRVNYDKTTGLITIVRISDGIVVYSNDAVIKTTGSNPIFTLITASVLFVLLVGSVVIIKRRKLTAKG